MALMPPARPSIPSAKLIAFITPTMQKTVIGTANIPVSNGPIPIKSPKPFNSVPPYNTNINDPVISPANFKAGRIRQTSSAKPVKVIIKRPVKKAIKSLSISRNNKQLTAKATAIAKPPKLGISLVCSLRSSGKSMTLAARANLMTTGINNMVNINELTPINPSVSMFICLIKGSIYN